jgi:hypothetical protein
MIICLSWISSTYAGFAPYIEGLYWRATETVDWALVNNLNTNNQKVSYLTSEYKFKPGFRLGLAYLGKWDGNLWYTRYQTRVQDSSSGNLTSAYMGGKIAQLDPAVFYKTGQFDSSIHLDMIDLDLGRRFMPANNLIIRPKIGLQSARINQTFNTQFQGYKSVRENISNDFTGIGPKAGIDAEILLQAQAQIILV